MTREKLRSIRTTIQQYRRQAANLKTDDMVSLADSLERTRRKGGDHLMYKSPLPGRRVLAITGHPSDPIGKGLALKMLNILEGDIDAWEEKRNKDDQNKTTKRIKGNGHG